MGQGKNWTPEETEYLCDKWGAISIPIIAKKLGRSVNAIKIRAQREGLGAHLESDYRVSLNQVLAAFDKSKCGCGYFIGRLTRAGCPIKMHRVNTCSFRIIDIDEFWGWAENHKNLFDWSKLESGILGPEPEWVPEKRRIDQSQNKKPHNTQWSPRDDNSLRTMLRQYKYTYADLSQYFARSEGAIKRRIHDLKLKERPIRSVARKWTCQEIHTLFDMYQRGYSFEQIAMTLKRTALQCRGKWENVVHPEWQRDIRQRKKEEKQKKKLLENLVYHLKIYRNNMEFGEYWQREMCMLWDDLEGCTADEANCDECISFQRIRPQYCRRCGAQVMNRKEIDICDRCKQIRKWQYRKKAEKVKKIYDKESVG